MTLPQLKLDADGLVTVVVQDRLTGEIRMVAYANDAAVEATLETGAAHFYSRSRRALWRKGEESGHVQEVRGVYIDCDADTILLKVHQVGGAACHEGYASCFFREVTPQGPKVIAEKLFDPKAVYKK